MTDKTPKTTVSRRAYLLAVGVGAASVAGCSSDDGDPDTEGETPDGGASAGTNTAPMDDGEPTDAPANGETATSAGDTATATATEVFGTPELDWGLFGHDIGNGGSAETGAPLKSPDTLWQFETDREVDGAPALRDGVLYAAAGDEDGGTVYALSAADGSKLWEHETAPLAGSTTEGGTPAVRDGTVYVGGREHQDEGGFSGPPAALLYALDAETGEEQWVFSTEDAFILNRPPVVHDGMVYVGAETVVGATSVYAVDAESGEQAWAREFGDQVTSPAIADGTAYVGSSTNGLHALDAATGEHEWVFDTGEFVLSEPSVRDGTVYVGNRVGVYAVDADSGEEAWFYEGGNIGTGSDAAQAVTDDAVYVTAQGAVARLTPDGEEVWRASTAASGGFPDHPLVTGKMVYATSNELRAFSAETGAEKWVLDVRATGRPIVSGGVIYVAGSDGVYALE